MTSEILAMQTAGWRETYERLSKAYWAAQAAYAAAPTDASWSKLNRAYKRLTSHMATGKGA